MERAQEEADPLKGSFRSQEGDCCQKEQAPGLTVKLEGQTQSQSGAAARDAGCCQVTEVAELLPEDARTRACCRTPGSRTLPQPQPAASRRMTVSSRRKGSLGLFELVSSVERQMRGKSESAGSMPHQRHRMMGRRVRNSPARPAYQALAMSRLAPAGPRPVAHCR
jgi:hypothetical protein